MVSGLCRWKLLQQKWLAYKSSLVSREILASKSSDADQCRAPRETTERKFPKLAWILAPKVAWIWRGFFWGREKGLKQIRRIRDKIRDKIRDNICDKICDKISGKIRDRVRAAKSKLLLCSELSD